MSIEDLARDEINAEILARLAEKLLPVIEPGEHTAAQYAEALHTDQNTAKGLLDDEVKAGSMTSRQVRSCGRRATAYRVVIGVG